MLWFVVRFNRYVEDDSPIANEDHPQIEGLKERLLLLWHGECKDADLLPPMKEYHGHIINDKNYIVWAVFCWKGKAVDFCELLHNAHHEHGMAGGHVILDAIETTSGFIADHKTRMEIINRWNEEALEKVYQFDQQSLDPLIYDDGSQRPR